MNSKELSLVVAVAAVTLAVGCATTGKTAAAALDPARGTADAIIHVSGLS